MQCWFWTMPLSNLGDLEWPSRDQQAVAFLILMQINHVICKGSNNLKLLWVISTKFISKSRNNTIFKFLAKMLVSNEESSFQIWYFFQYLSHGQDEMGSAITAANIVTKIPLLEGRTLLTWMGFHLSTEWLLVQDCRGTLARILVHGFLWTPDALGQEQDLIMACGFYSIWLVR